MPSSEPSEIPISIRPARESDLSYIVALDAGHSGDRKPDYWRDIFQRFVARGLAGRYFLVAEAAGRVIGFIVGEVRAWEFGSPPTGWVFAINVDADQRESGIANRLLEHICAGFKEQNVDTVRTMISREDTVIMSFFRSQGLKAGPFVELEKRI